MKKNVIYLLAVLFFLSSCSSYTATGAYTGSQVGYVFGSVIGGLNGGWRGEHMGALIGTMGGAVAGAAVGAAIENAQQRKYEEARHYPRSVDESGFDATNSGDDRIIISNDDPTPAGDDDRLIIGDDNRVVMKTARRPGPPVQILNAQVKTHRNDNLLCRGEECQVVFEVMNRSAVMVYDVCPIVEETTGNKHVHVSPNIRIESLAPYQGIRYTATVKGDNRLKDGQAVIDVGVSVSGHRIDSQNCQFTLPTRKKVL